MKYFVVRKDRIIEMQAIREDHHAKDGWRIMTTIRTRRSGNLYGRVLEENELGNIRHARFNSEKSALDVINELKR